MLAAFDETAAETTLFFCRSSGRGPTTTTPGSRRNSLICCRPRSISPFTRASPTNFRPRMTLLLAATSSAMPSLFSKTLATYVPLAPSEYPIDLASSKALQRDAAVEMSGSGWPFSRRRRF